MPGYFKIYRPSVCNPDHLDLGITFSCVGLCSSFLLPNPYQKLSMEEFCVWDFLKDTWSVCDLDQDGQMHGHGLKGSGPVLFLSESRSTSECLKAMLLVAPLLVKVSICLSSQPSVFQSSSLNQARPSGALSLDCSSVPCVRRTW